ncbi:probable myosin light chain kinase DDB_G0279831 [Clytia hemisphaerica]
MTFCSTTNNRKKNAQFTISTSAKEKTVPNSYDNRSFLRDSFTNISDYDNQQHRQQRSPILSKNNRSCQSVYNENMRNLTNLSLSPSPSVNSKDKTIISNNDVTFSIDATSSSNTKLPPIMDDLCLSNNKRNFDWLNCKSTNNIVVNPLSTSSTLSLTAATNHHSPLKQQSNNLIKTFSNSNNKIDTKAHFSSSSTITQSQIGTKWNKTFIKSSSQSAISTPRTINLMSPSNSVPSFNYRGGLSSMSITERGGDSAHKEETSRGGSDRKVSSSKGTLDKYFSSDDIIHEYPDENIQNGLFLEIGQVCEEESSTDNDFIAPLERPIGLKRSCTNDERMMTLREIPLQRCQSIDSTKGLQKQIDEQARFFSEQTSLRPRQRKTSSNEKPQQTNTNTTVTKSRKKLLRRSMSTGFSKIKLIKSSISFTKSHQRFTDEELNSVDIKDSDHQTSRRKNTSCSSPLDEYIEEMSKGENPDRDVDSNPAAVPFLRSISAPEQIDKLDGDVYDEDLSELYLPRRRAICPNLPVPAMKQLKTYLILTRLKQYCFV